MPKAVNFDMEACLAEDAAISLRNALLSLW